MTYYCFFVIIYTTMVRTKTYKYIVFLLLAALASFLLAVPLDKSIAPTGNNDASDAANPPQISRSNQTKDNKADNVTAGPAAQNDGSMPTYQTASKVDQQQRTITQFGKTYPLRTYEPLSLPNDTYANQWWVAPTGMENAWATGAGANNIKIAIIDTGFALNHQEFSGRWATNSGESGITAQQSPSKLNCADGGLSLEKSCNNIDDDFDGIVDNESGTTTRQNPSWLNCTDQGRALDKSCNRRDDDGNGYVDDVNGWDFSNFDHSAQAGEVNPDGSGTTHGTMTAGILGASGNNGVGIAGVNWSTKILPLQALDDFEYGDSYTVGQAVYYAADQGADIISISLGTDADDPYLREAILYALERDIIVVAAAGNDGCNCISYPANYPEVVAVGAANTSNGGASFSSFGSELDIVAPGQGMTVPYWTKNNGVSSYAGGAAGTSFSAPFVAGLLGLMRSHQPDASWDELSGVLFENSDRRTLTAASPRSNSFGFGFVRSDLALSRVSQVLSPAITYQFSGMLLGSERIKACESGVLPGSFIYELTKNGSINYTLNQYERRKAVAAGWSARQLFGICVGLPTDMPTIFRSISLTQEILNLQLKQ